MPSNKDKIPRDLFSVNLIEFGTPEFDEEIALRDKVLRKPLNLEYTPGQIQEEWDSVHLGLYHPSGQLLACLVLKPLSNGVWKMRQVAVDPDWQGKGLGSLLVDRSEKYLLREGAAKLVLHARETAVKFYKDLGYFVFGDPFVEVGIPHRSMQKELSNEKN